MPLCRTCGSTLDPQGMCAACLLGTGLDTVTDAYPDTTGTPEGASEDDSFGPYSIVRLLGEGGMGAVYLAVQSQPFQRHVALKVIRRGLNSAEIVSRFNYERQSLALMDHPNIARIYDAGTSRSGHPYFAMEYVDGVPITLYCDQHKLTLTARLELFVFVCQALQHAHQRGVIHRDIKPSNVLVAEIEGHAVPKVIDFGIARAIEQTVQTSAFTLFGQFMGTPEYMSPEQSDPVVGDVDTSSDVYSLGVLLYELLIGVTPFDGRALRHAGLAELLRVIRDDEAPAMPVMLLRMGTAAIVTAGDRGTDIDTLHRLIRGDLNSIVMRAIDKDRRRRYPTAIEFAADIQRYLGNRPVLASPPTLLYRARKFARRHRLGVVAASVVALVLSIAIGVSIRQSLRANREAAAAQAVNEFLQNDLLAQASAANQGGAATKPDPDMKVRTALDRAAVRIAGKFQHQPEVEAAIRDTMGQTYMDLGLYAEAARQLERARDLHRQVLGDNDPKTVRSMSHLGRSDLLQGRYAEAEKQLSRALDVERYTLGLEHTDTLYSMTNLAVCYRLQGKYAQAEDLQTQALEIRRRVFGPEHPETLRAMNSLGNIYSALGKYQQAEALDQQILEIRRRLLGPEYPDVLYSMTNLAEDYRANGRLEEAEALLIRTIEIDRRVLGGEHSATLHSANILANVYYSQGKYAESEELHSQTLNIMRRVLGAEHLDSLLVTSNLATDYCARGKFAEAKELFAQALAIETRTLNPAHPVLLYTTAGFGCMYHRWGKYDLAESYAAKALEGRRHALGAEHPETLQSASDLAFAYVSQGKFQGAETLARETLAIHQKNRPKGWQRFSAASLLGASLAGQKRFDEAEPLLLEGYRGMEARQDHMGIPEREHLTRTAKWIVALYDDWGKPAKAAPFRPRQKP